MIKLTRMIASPRVEQFRVTTGEELAGAALVDAFFAPWEKVVEDFGEINETITTLFQRLVRDEGRLFAWRGVVNASWPFHSSLYRRIV